MKRLSIVLGTLAVIGLVAMSGTRAQFAVGSTQIKWVELSLERFPRLLVDWTIGAISGEFEGLQFLGGTLDVPAETAAPATAMLSLRDAASGEIYCDVEIHLEANSCASGGTSSARCAVVRAGASGDICTVQVSRRY